MRILLVEDDADLVRPLRNALKSDGYVIDTAKDGEQGYALARGHDYGLIILDYNLPKLDGRAITERLRQERIPTPILMLTVRSEVSDKVSLLQLGVDDYLTKPFSLSELLARVKAISRRPRVWQGEILKCGQLEMNPDRFLVMERGRRVSLSSKEFSLLEYLLRNRGRIISRAEIMEHVWDENADPFSNTIETHIGNLRRKLASGSKLISTFSSRGYKIDEER